MLTTLITNEMDALLLSETKIDETFSLEQFLISGFAKPLRLDRNSRSGGIMLFIRDNIPFRLLQPTYDIDKVLDSYIGNYDNFLIAGDLNSEITESSVREFCSCTLHSLIYF